MTTLSERPSTPDVVSASDMLRKQCKPTDNKPPLDRVSELFNLGGDPMFVSSSFVRASTNLYYYYYYYYYY